MSKKVAIFYAGAKNWGGVETYIEQLFENVDKKKLELILVSFGKWELGERLQKGGFGVITLSSSWYNPVILWQLVSLVKGKNFNLIASQGMVANFFGGIVSLVSRVPSLVTVHSDYKYDYHGYKKYLYATTFWLTKAFTKRYITVSKFLKNEIMKFGIPDEKIIVVYNGVVDVGEQAKLPEGQIIIGSMARLHHKKGYQMLIEAVSKLTDLDWKLYIWGEGAERPKLERLIDELNLKDRVYLPGFTKDVPGSMAQVDIYIQPSLEEGFGITVAEAMYSAKPIIVTPAGSLPELITDGKTGLITPDVSNEAIAIELREAIENIGQLRSLGEAARVAALQRFGIDTWIRNIAKVYADAAV